MKQAYVRMVQTIRPAASAIGLLDGLERRLPSPTALWARSLFAIHDAEEMVRLDVPWWEMRSIGHVDRFLRGRPGARVFEYGAGASTVWLAKRASEVRFVEHHAEWKARVDAMLADRPNASGEHAPPVDSAAGTESRYLSSKPGWTGLDFEQYVRAIERAGGSFDCIVIDGRCRERCLEIAIEHLSPGGLIVFDNSGRKRYQTEIKACGLPAVRLRGFTVALPYPDETTLIFADENARDRLMARE